MRTDPRYSRVRNMLTASEVPRFLGGGIALCHGCQRQVYFDGGFLLLLTKQVRREAKAAAFKRAQATIAARREADVAQRIEPPASNREVAGSSPAVCAITAGDEAEGGVNQ